jgi:hypothetical protein
MDVETCSHCGKPLAVEVGSSFLCCLECNRRLLGYAWWPSSGPSGPLAVFRSRAEAEGAAAKGGGGPIELSVVWTDAPKR